MKQIKVYKLKGGVDPVKTFTDINPDFSYTIASLGSPTKQVDGMYECEVVSLKGKSLRWKVKVISWGFPRVTGEMSSSDKVLTYTCSANTSRLPVEIEIYAQMNGIEGMVRLDNDTRVTKEMSLKDEVTNITLQIPKRIIKYPMRKIVCRARNEAGERERYDYFDYSQLPGYYIGSDYPHFIKHESSIRKNLNGSLTIICKAHGKKPLVMGFFLNRISEENDLTNDDQTIKTDTVQGDTTVSTLTLPAKRLTWPTSRLYCTAKNAEGDASYEFYIRG